MRATQLKYMLQLLNWRNLITYVDIHDGLAVSIIYINVYEHKCYH